VIAIILFPFAILALWMAGIVRLAKRSMAFRLVLFALIVRAVLTVPAPPTTQEQRTASTAARTEAALAHSYATAGWSAFK
jgi:hypothetical protein